MPLHPKYRARRSPLALTLFALAMGSLLLSGCVSSKKYRMAKQDVTPTQLLNWSTTSPDTDLTLATMIVFKSPGSWKREARWDEYVIQIHHRGDLPLIVESAELVDVLDQSQFPGDDPWALEKLSLTNWDKYGKTGLKLLAGAGALAVYTGAMVGVAYGSILAGGAGGTALAVLNIVPVIALVDIVAVSAINRKNKSAVQAEFDRRRLVLPLVVESGSPPTGSLFFPMTPGPKTLRLRGRQGTAHVELMLDLAPLENLHLKPKK
jgi:hypothetical protein